MFGYERTGKRKFIEVSPAQGAALEFYFNNFDKLAPLMTLTKMEIAQARYRGYVTREELDWRDRSE